MSEAKPANSPADALPEIYSGRFPAREVDAQVIAMLRAGEADALTDLCRVYGARVFSLCRRMLGNDADAEDATQDVFLRVFEQIARFSGRSLFSTWLFRVAANHVRNLLKARRRRWTRSLADVDEDEHPRDDRPLPGHRLTLADERAALDGLLELLPIEQRTALLLRELEGMSYGQIAEVLEVPVGTVTSRIVRGRERLRQGWAKIRAAEEDFGIESRAAIVPRR